MVFLDKVDPVLCALGVSSLLKAYVLSKHVVETKVLVGKVSGLVLHPLKSGHGVEVPALSCTFREGPLHGELTDRHWMVTTDDYSLVNLYQFPILSTVTPSFKEGCMTLTPSNGHKSFSVDIQGIIKKNKIITASAYGTTVQGLDCGDEAANWLSGFLDDGKYCLVYAPPQFDAHRDVKTGNVSKMEWTKAAKDKDVLAFQSVTPFHVLTQASVDDLNSRIDDTVGADRFRPNIIVTGPDAFDEDRWRKMWIGDSANFSTIRLTGRCVFVNINPENGESCSEPLKTLTRYRSVMKNYNPCMGLHMVLEQEGPIRVGDPVYATYGDNTIMPK